MNPAKKRLRRRFKKRSKNTYSKKFSYAEQEYFQSENLNQFVKDALSNKDKSIIEGQSIDAVGLYDPHLLETALNQWQLCDWESLASLDKDVVARHPYRAELALLVTLGHLQTDSFEEGKKLLRLSKEWGCSKKQISLVLISSAYNNLGAASALGKQNQRAVGYFEKAAEIGRLFWNLHPAVSVQFDKLKKWNGLIDLNGLKKQIKPEPQENDELDFSSAKLLVYECFENQELVDAIESINSYLLSSSLTKKMKFNFCYVLVHKFIEKQDNLMAIHFISSASEFAEKEGPMAEKQFSLFSKTALKIGQDLLSIDLMVRSHSADPVISDAIKIRLLKAYGTIRKSSKKKSTTWS